MVNGLTEEDPEGVYASQNVQRSIHIPSPSAYRRIEPTVLSSLYTTHHTGEVAHPVIASEAIQGQYPDTDKTSPRAESCVPSPSILDMSIVDMDSSPVPRSPREIMGAKALHHFSNREEMAHTPTGRNSLESLAELERLIEEQHRELVARGILPADDDILDSSVQGEFDSDAKSFNRHLSSIRQVASVDQDLLKFGENKDDFDQFEFAKFKADQCANMAEAKRFPNGISDHPEEQGCHQLPRSIFELSGEGRKSDQGDADYGLS